MNRQHVLCKVTGGALCLLGFAGLGDAAAATYSDTVLADNPIGYYRFSETSGRAIDNAATNNGNFYATVSGSSQDVGDVDLTVSGPALLGFGGSNSAVGFNGDDDGDKLDFVRAPIGTTQIGNSYGFTIEAWVKAGTDNSGYIAAITHSNNSPVYGLRLVGGDAGFQARRGNGSVTVSGSGDKSAGTDTSANITYDSNYAVDDGAWHYLAVVFELDTANEDNNTAGTDGADATPHRVRFYVDPTGTTPYATVYHAAQHASSDRFGIGSYDSYATGNAFMSGAVDEVAIYGAALSGAQIKAHYDAGLVPEPASLGLIGLAGLLALRRRA